MTERVHLARAIAAFERQRAELGDDVVNAALAPLRRRLAELARQAPSASEERKQATVLLADVCGFAVLSATLDAEDLGDLMNALWERIDAVVVANGGTVDKHIGDAVMALWGVVRVQEHDPERAVRAALEIQGVVRAFRSERRLPLSMRIGVHTGPIVWGGVGTVGESSAVGQTVNVASRLEKGAAPDAVLVSDETYRHVKGLFDVMPDTALAVSWQHEPLATYRVLRPRPRALRSPARGVEGIETRAVGREQALTTLQRQLLAAFETPGSCMVTVLGDAGIGKSRLLYELERWIDRQPLDPLVFKSRALPTLGGVPYGVLRDLVAFRFDIQDTDDAAVVMSKLRAEMSIALDADEADLVGQLFGFDLSASPAVRRLLDSPSFRAVARRNWLRYVEAVAASPAVVFLDDLHWADDSSLDLVADMLHAVPTGRMLIACTARPPLLDRRPYWPCRGATADRSASGCTTDGRHLLLPLGPLDAASTRALLEEILQRAACVPDRLADLVVHASGGNPYFVEELVKRLIEDGVIVRGTEQWQVLVDRLGTVRVPSTLNGVIQARLDSLPPDHKRVLQRASIVGRTFWDDLVIELCADSLPSGAVRDALRSLARRELIQETNGTALGGSRAYAFRHAILRDVAVDTVLRKERRALHTTIARWLESHAGERVAEHWGLIAGHYELAGEAQAAADCLRRHAEELRRLGAYRDAIAVGTRGLALLSDGDQAVRAALSVTIGEAHRLKGEYPDAVRLLEQGLAIARQASDAATEIHALNGLGLSVRVLGDNDRAAAYLSEAYRIASSHGEKAGMARSLYNLGDVAFRRGDADAAARYGAESLALFTQLGDRQGRAYALRVIGFAEGLRSELALSERFHVESRDTFVAIGDRWGEAAGLINLGEVARKRGDPATAARRFETALEIARETDARYEVLVCQCNLGHAYAGLGDAATARACLAAALRGALALGTWPIALEAAVGIAVLLQRAERWEEAVDLLGVVYGHPALCNEVTRYADPVLDAARNALPADRIEEALASGRGIGAEAVTTSLLRHVGR